MYLAIRVYLRDFHNTYTSLSMKTYPLVDFESLKLDIQLASLYSYSIVE